MLFPIRTLSPIGRSAGASSLYQGLVSYWKLDEASGTRNDSKGTNHLTSNNGVTQDNGKLGKGASFTRASNQYLSVADNASLTPGSALSISMWVYRSGGQTFELISKQDYSSNGSWRMEVNSAVGGESRFYFTTSVSDAGVHYGVTPSGLIADATWAHLVWVYDGSQVGNAGRLKCWVNGSAQTLTFSGSSVPSSLPDDTTDLRLGNLFLAGAPFFSFNGVLDDVGYWNRAITSTEVSLLYAGGSGLALY